MWTRGSARLLPSSSPNYDESTEIRIGQSRSTECWASFGEPLTAPAPPIASSGTLRRVTARRPRPTAPLALAAALLLGACAAVDEPGEPSLQSGGPRSACDFGLSPERTAEENRDALQAAIDWASPRGAALWIEPSEEPYPLASGLRLRRNVSLLGAHGPVGRGTRGSAKAQPVGSAFAVRDGAKALVEVESATRIEGLQFWYPEQALTEPAAIQEYPPTIRVAQDQPVYGVTLSRLSFFGESFAMDFEASARFPCEQILIEHCTGYPLSGRFVSIDHCTDVPRVLHCHVNPANRRLFAGDAAPPLINAVVARGTFAFAVDHTDDAVLEDLFAFGTYGGASLGPASYGQLTGFGFDCVTIGVRKGGDSDFNRDWMIAQGSIVANTGKSVADVHPLVVEGRGHLAVTNVQAFSGPNAALTTLGRSRDFLLVRGGERLTVSLVGCRMRGYEQAEPVTLENPRATVSLVGCFDRDERPCEGVPGLRP